MTRDAIPLDLADVPELRRQVDDVTHTGRARALQENGETVAVLIPARRAQRRSTGRALVDTSGLPPSRYQSLDELIADREPPPPRAFTWEEIEDTLDRERATAWRAKYR